MPVSDDEKLVMLIIGNQAVKVKEGVNELDVDGERLRILYMLGEKGERLEFKVLDREKNEWVPAKLEAGKDGLVYIDIGGSRKPVMGLTKGFMVDTVLGVAVAANPSVRSLPRARVSEESLSKKISEAAEEQGQSNPSPEAEGEGPAESMGKNEPSANPPAKEEVEPSATGSGAKEEGAGRGAEEEAEDKLVAWTRNTVLCGFSGLGKTLFEALSETVFEALLAAGFPAEYIPRTMDVVGLAEDWLSRLAPVVAEPLRAGTRGPADVSSVIKRIAWGRLGLPADRAKDELEHVDGHGGLLELAIAMAGEKGRANLARLLSTDMGDIVWEKMKTASLLVAYTATMHALNCVKNLEDEVNMIEAINELRVVPWMLGFARDLAEALKSGSYDRIRYVLDKYTQPAPPRTPADILAARITRTYKGLPSSLKVRIYSIELPSSRNRENQQEAKKAIKKPEKVGMVLVTADKVRAEIEERISKYWPRPEKQLAPA